MYFTSLHTFNITFNLHLQFLQIKFLIFIYNHFSILIDFNFYK